MADGVIGCPTCGNDRISKITRKTASKNKRAQLYRCLEKICKQQFSATSGTIFHDSHLSLTKWFMAIALVVDAKKGMSAKRLQQHLGIGSYRTAWYMAHRIREAMVDVDPTSAQLFVAEGAYVFITGRRREKVDEAVKLIGRNVTGVQGDAANLDDLDRLFDTVRYEKGRIDVLFASAGSGESAKIGEVTEKHFDTVFALNTNGTLFTVQKALPLFNDGGSIIMNGSVASVKGWPEFSVYSASKAALRSFARTWLNELKDRKIRVNVLSPGQVATPIQEQLFDAATIQQFESLIPRGKMGRPEEIATWPSLSLRATQATSTEWSCRLMVEPQRFSSTRSRKRWNEEKTDDGPSFWASPSLSNETSASRE